MTNQFNQSNHSFIIQITAPSGNSAGYMRIDQLVNNKNWTREQTRVRNAVEQRLTELNERTGCTYLVIYEGNPEMATAILNAEQECPF